MSEIIHVQCPDDLKGTTEITIGNFRAELKAGETIETDSRNFADYLIYKHGCSELDLSLRGVLSRMSVADLKVEAKNSGVSGFSAMNKGALVDAILAAKEDPPKDEAPGDTGTGENTPPTDQTETQNTDENAGGAN